MANERVGAVCQLIPDARFQFIYRLDDSGSKLLRVFSRGLHLLVHPDIFQRPALPCNLRPQR